jgi:hypothetical protein
LLGIAPRASAQFHTIEVSAEPYQYECLLFNDVPGVRTVYVRSTFNSGSTASRFKVTLGAGVTLTYLSEVHPFAMTVGNTQAGISVCYGDCVWGDLLLATIDYMAYGTGPNCGEILVVPHPDSQAVEILDCDGSPRAAWIRDVAIPSPGNFCSCPSPHLSAGNPKLFDCTPTPIEATTWGAVKALYRN